MKLSTLKSIESVVDRLSVIGTVYVLGNDDASGINILIDIKPMTEYKQEQCVLMQLTWVYKQKTLAQNLQIPVKTNQVEKTKHILNIKIYRRELSHILRTEGKIDYNWTLVRQHTDAQIVTGEEMEHENLVIYFNNGPITYAIETPILDEQSNIASTEEQSAHESIVMKKPWYSLSLPKMLPRATATRKDFLQRKATHMRKNGTLKEV
jgi:hypothetical protein